MIEDFQERAADWAELTFGDKILYDRQQRNQRFFEEAIELVQSLDMPKDKVLALVEYVYGREKGEPEQEVGGVSITLLTLCHANGIYQSEAVRKEYMRISTPANIQKIREKQKLKPIYE